MASKEFRKEIRFSGSGGQGLILAGIILAKAAAIDGFNTTQTQSYGPESRGGYSRADVIIGNTDIYFPEATNFDILLSLTQEACDKYLYDLKETGVLITDSSLVKNISMTGADNYEVPFTEIAIKELGSPQPTNLLSLSFLVRVTSIVTEKALQAAIEASVKPAFVDINLKAMQLGFKLADEYKK